MAYEETFGIEITDDLAETMTSVGKSIDVICQIKKLK
jgi:acyl carrier protein